MRRNSKPVTDPVAAEFRVPGGMAAKYLNGVESTDDLSRALARLWRDFTQMERRLRVLERARSEEVAAECRRLDRRRQALGR